MRVSLDLRRLDEEIIRVETKEDETKENEEKEEEEEMWKGERREEEKNLMCVCLLTLAPACVCLNVYSSSVCLFSFRPPCLHSACKRM